MDINKSSDRVTWIIANRGWLDGIFGERSVERALTKCVKEELTTRVQSASVSGEEVKQTQGPKRAA